MPRRPRHITKIPLGAEKFLAVFEGLEGGFAIGAGVLAGLSFAGLDRKILLMTAVVSIIVNGFNSSAVKYSSEHYIDELDGHETRHPFRRYFIPSLFEFISYFAISFISILPLVFMDNMPNAILYSCIITIGILFLAGYWRATLVGAPKWRDALETAILGSGIILVGLSAGWITHNLA